MRRTPALSPRCPQRLAAAAMACVAFALLALTPACAEQEPETLLRAKRVESINELIGGDVAMGRVGDWLLENDKVRVVILDVESSPGPGVFGGTLADADIRRPDGVTGPKHGRDTLAEVFPFANLLTPKPGTMDVRIVSDGSDGEQAVVRVSGEGFFFLEALALLRLDLVIGFLFPDTKAYLFFETDYILEPGASYVRMVSRARRADPVPAQLIPNPIIPFSSSCDEELECDGVPIGDFHDACPAGVVFDDDDGCATCECATTDVLRLPNFQGPAAVFSTLVGDGDTSDGIEPGILAGDWVFFGGQNDLFGPGMGFDEDKEIFDALWEGRDTFSNPLEFDYMAATGPGVSYAYFTANPPGEPDPKVLVPMITSSATAFGTAGIQCLDAEEDDETCDRYVTWEWERYLAIGEGDVASLTDIMYEVRGTETGTLRGTVFAESGEPMPNARVLLFADPDPSRDWESIHAIADANFRATSQPGLLNDIHADPGFDPDEDGRFDAKLRPGSYVLVAAEPGLMAFSVLQRVTVEAGEATIVNPVVPPPARLDVEVTDSEGRLLPAKLTFVSLDEAGEPMDFDGTNPTYLGRSRYGAGVRHLEFTHTGRAHVAIEPGRYRLVVSHGPENGLSVHELDLVSGKTLNVRAVCAREVQTDGWISGDFHLHAEPSFDSGMPLPERVTRVAAEGLEFAVSTDHDVVTDYRPTIRQLGLQDAIQSAVGVELSTLELGHFIAWPLDYDFLDVPDHNAPDWLCKSGPELMDELAAHFVPGAGGTRIMAHPRDGFIGYISQLGVNPYDMTREVSLLSASNVMLREATCSFDAMELFNSKRFDLIRTPTNEEVVLYNRCLDRIDQAADVGDLITACPELRPGAMLDPCPADERFFECQMRQRRELAFVMLGRILERTPEEQAAFWAETADTVDEELCNPGTYVDGDGNQLDLPPEDAIRPCAHHPGTFEDWIRWNDAGLRVPITAASDSHGAQREPGQPRTYVRSSSDLPNQIDPYEISRNMNSGRALPTYGPFIEHSIGGVTSGDTVTVTGDTFDLDVRVQTASWFGVDRVEVFVGHELVHVETFDHGPEVIVDYEETLTLPLPDEDTFVAVVALGLRKENLMRPVYFDVPFGELAIPKVVSLAFSGLPVDDFLKEQIGLTPDPPVPDLNPVYPFAVTNAIWVDVDGNGTFDRPDSVFPAFCPRDCDPDAELGEDDPPQCPPGQVCLLSGVCGEDLQGQCSAAPADAGLGSAMMSLAE